MLKRWRQRIGLSSLKIAVLIPLLVCICVLAAVILYSLHLRHETEDSERIHELVQSAQLIFQRAVEQDVNMMASTLRAITDIEALKSSFLARDRDALYHASQSLFESLQRNFDITHFYFSGPDRVNFLRVHQRSRYGDTIERQTTLLAARDGKLAHGLELGPLGTFTLRVVMPWRSDEGIIGYIELGKEIENIIDEVGGIADTGIYAFVPKQFLEQKRWEEGMQMLGRIPSWGRLREVVLTSERGENVPSQLVELVNSGFLETGEMAHEQRWDERYVWVAHVPVIDVGGQVRAHLVLVDDVSAQHFGDERLTLLIIIISTVIGAGLMGLFWLILSRVERNLQKKEQLLQENLTNRHIVAEILRLSLEPVSLHEKLQQSLDLVLSSYEFGLQTKGCIFLVDKHTRELVMEAQSGLADPLLELCDRVPFGHCLCGRAAQTGAILHVDCIDERHEIRFEGMQPHGHYCTPIMAEGEVLGVLNIYVPEGHQRTDDEDRLVSSVSDTLAGVIRRQHTANELEQQRILFEAVFRDVPDAMALTNTQREFIDCNPAMTRIFGYEPEELIGRQSIILYESEAEFERRGEIRFNLLAEEKAEPYLVNYRRKNGEVFPGETVGTAIKDKNGDTLGFIGVIRDVSERVKAEQALQLAHDELEQRIAERTQRLSLEIEEHERAELQLTEAEERSRLLLESAGEGIYGVDKEGITTFLNPAALRMLGYPRDALIGRSMHDTIHHSYADGSPYPEEECPMHRTLCEGSGHHASDDILWREDGTSFPVDYTSTPIIKKGEVVGAVITFRDITELKQAEKALRDAKEKAEAANLAKSRFLATMSHELRTPLNAILGYSELLSEEAAEHGQQVMLPDLDRIHSSGRHLLGLINDILDLSKIEAGRMGLHNEPFAVADMVYEVTAAVQPLAQKNGNSLEVEYGKAIGTMVADQTKVRQILFNLLSNAVKFTHDGRIRLEVLKESPKRTVFRIIDTGIGISGKQLDQVFEAFRQVDDSSNRQYEGTGLGLSITKRLCEMMGGEIEVESEPHIGSIFTVRLPQNQGEAQY